MLLVCEKPYVFACGNDDDEDDVGDEIDDDCGENDVEIKKEVKTGVSEIVPFRASSRNLFSELPFVADMVASKHYRMTEGWAMGRPCAHGI